MKKWILLCAVTFVLTLAACGTTDKENNSAADEPIKEPLQTDTNPTNDEASSNEKVKGLLDNLEMTVHAEQGEEGIMFEFELINKNQEDLSLTFPSGQQYEIILSKEGQKVYQYSEGKMFTQALVNEELKSGEAKFWKEVWKPETGLEAGQYEVEMTLFPQEINQQEIASEAFKKTITIQLTEVKEKEVELDEPFRNLEVSGKKGNYQITGELHSSIGKAYYEVEDGHNYLVAQTAIPIDEDGWQPFQLSITISEDLLPQNGALMLLLFNEDRSIQLPVVLEKSS